MTEVMLFLLVALLLPGLAGCTGRGGAAPTPPAPAGGAAPVAVADPAKPAPPASATGPAVPTASLSPTPLPSAPPTAGATPTATRTPSPPPTLSPTPTSTPSPTPLALRRPVHAVRLDFANWAESRGQVAGLEGEMRRAGVNLVALGAGRVEWTYFKWVGHEDRWSSDVSGSGTDYLADDARRFGAWAQTAAVIDVYAPRYIQSHPEAAAVSWLGRSSPYLVSTTQLVDGAFGRELLDMADAIAGNYPVDFLTLTEIAYHTDGYGADDRAAYLAATGRKDWPRLANGQIDIDHPSIGQWRSAQIARFVRAAAAIVHRHGKHLLMDVSVSWGHLDWNAAESGQDYPRLLSEADGLVVWTYFELNGYAPEYAGEVARYLRRIGDGRVVLSIGLWGRTTDQTISADALRRSLAAAAAAGLPDAWITPSLRMTPAHWQVLADLWNPAP